MFMPDFQRVRAFRNTFDAKAAVRIGHSVEWVRVDTNVGLHPAMDIAFHNQKTWALGKFDEP